MTGATDAAHDSIIDLEQYAKDGTAVPPHRPGQTYRIRIDKTHKVVGQPRLTGSQILALVDKTPQSHRLDQKLRGGQTRKIDAAEVVDFTAPGIERFMTLPLDQTEGGGTGAGCLACAH